MCCRVARLNRGIIGQDLPTDEALCEFAGSHRSALLVEYCDRQDLAHALLAIRKGETDRSYWIRVCAKMFHVSQEQRSTHSSTIISKGRIVRKASIPLGLSQEVNSRFQ